MNDWLLKIPRRFISEPLKIVANFQMKCRDKAVFFGHTEPRACYLAGKASPKKKHKEFISRVSTVKCTKH